ncbi:MAG: hypothetical protein ACXVPU_07115 [Bacteroidia bacterium]
MTDITQDEIERFHLECEERKIRSVALDKKHKELEQLIGENKFPLTGISWHTEMKDVDFSVLDDFEGWENKEYEILWLPTDKVADLYISTADKKFPKEKLFGIREDYKIAKLVQHLENGEKVIPPVIRYVGGERPIMFDQGNHRFALSRFLKLSEIPFVIEKCDVSSIKALFV